ncbi:MAG: T9SS type A sorting domain-containing protein [Flavobacteriales bacterium]|nr:T9SS type A sorting domain-containing protein [Flavobacteriales bacterium]
MAIHGDGQFTLYPNPNHGDQLFVSLSQVQEGVQTVNVDIFDLTGKRVSARTIPVQDGSARTNLNLNGDLSGGMYMVHVTVGDRTYTERLVIQP